MKDSKVLWLKVALVLLLTILFMLLIYTDETKLQKGQPEGEPVQAEEVLILVNELVNAGVIPKDAEMLEAVKSELASQLKKENEPYITYELYCNIWKAFLGEESSEEGSVWDEILLAHKYQSEFWIVKEDWYQSYEEVLHYYNLADVITEKKIKLLGGKENILGESKPGEKEILDGEGNVYTYQEEEFGTLSGCVVKAYVRGEKLLTCTQVLKETFQLSNVWVMEATEEGIRFFYKGYEVYVRWDTLPKEPEKGVEQVADLTLGGGSMKKMELKTEKISGKILRVNETEVEIEGYGSYKFAEKCRGYRLYETLKEAGISELSIGYNFADFVVEEGEICSFLLVRKEKMETIRVLIKNSGFHSLYQEKIEICCEEDMIITYGAYEERKQEKISAGDVLTLEKDSAYLRGEQAEVAPISNTGKMQVLSIERSMGKPSYRGKLEISLTEEGLVLINEVLLEEYLYSVVPSEMPASYPMEALKAQAVCARTYAYGYLLAPGLGGLGAHMDDSTAYQVYNNISENISTTKAVKETDGEILMCEGSPINAYYYSTSCGYGSDERVWSTHPEKELPYLEPLYLGDERDTDKEEGKMLSPEELREEVSFQEYITQRDENAFEKEEAWYRWSYEEEEFRAEVLYERLMERYRAVPEKILTCIGEEEVPKAAPEKFSEVYDISCTQRLPGGGMNELTIVTDKGTYKVVSEYNIRYVLNTGREVLRQDGSVYAGGSLLPSAYFVLETRKDLKGMVTGYKVLGGGYGHGAGMSQNGAKNMAASGYKTEEILSFFFRNCVIEDQY